MEGTLTVEQPASPRPSFASCRPGVERCRRGEDVLGERNPNRGPAKHLGLVPGIRGSDLKLRERIDENDGEDH